MHRTEVVGDEHIPVGDERHGPDVVGVAFEAQAPPSRGIPQIHALPDRCGEQAPIWTERNNAERAISNVLLRDGSYPLARDRIQYLHAAGEDGEQAPVGTERFMQYPDVPGPLFEHMQAPPGSGVPHLHPVGASCGEQAPVGTERHIIDTQTVAFEGVQMPPGGGIPHQHNLVAGPHEQMPVGTERHFASPSSSSADIAGDSPDQV